jgi:hypothetical protein
VNNGTTSERGRHLSETVQGGSHQALRLGHSSRQLGGVPLCDKFKFEFIVGEKKTTYNAKQFHEHLLHTQRVVQLQHLLNDPKLTNGQPHDIEVAIRITGCKLENMFTLSHIYWA